MKASRLIIRAFSIGLSGVLLFTNSVFAHSYEANFWKERQKKVELASLPQPYRTIGHLPNLPAVSKSIPAGVTSKRIQKWAQPNSPAGLTKILKSLPVQFGSIRNVILPKNNSSNKIVVHIHDVHMNQEAQRNIASAVQELIRQETVDFVALEGAFQPLQLTEIRKFPRRDAVIKVADYLLRINKISGPIHTAFVSPNPIPSFIGVDDPLHYRKNLEAVKKSYPLKSKREESLRKARQILREEKKRILNIQLALFDEMVESYRSKKIEMGSYVEQLARYSSEVPLSVETFLEALKTERSLDFNQVENQRTKLLSTLLKKLKDQQTSGLIDTSVAFRTGRITHSEFYEYLNDLCQSNGVNLERFPAMNAYLTYVLLSESIDIQTLILDLRKLEVAIFESLINTKVEKDLIDQSRKIYLTEKLVDFSLTKEEWLELMDIPQDRLELSDLTTFLDFYKEAEIRDQSISRNLLEEMTKGFNASILVTGGFHDEGIRQRLQENGVTVISWSPKITKVEGDKGSAYLSVFTQEKTHLDKLFQGETLFLASRPMIMMPSAQKLLVLADDESPNAARRFGRFIWKMDKNETTREIIRVWVIPAALGTMGVIGFLNNWKAIYWVTPLIFAAIFLLSNVYRTLKRGIRHKQEQLNPAEHISTDSVLMSPSVGMIPWLWAWFVPRLQKRGWGDKKIAGVLGSAEELIFSGLIVSGGAPLIRYLFGISLGSALTWASLVSLLLFTLAHWRAVVRIKDGFLTQPSNPTIGDKATIFSIGIIFRVIYFLTINQTGFDIYNFSWSIILVMLSHGIYNSFFAPIFGLSLAVIQKQKLNKTRVLQILKENDWDLSSSGEEMGMSHGESFFDFFDRLGIQGKLKIQIEKMLKENDWLVGPSAENFGVSAPTLKSLMGSLNIERPTLDRGRILSSLIKNKWNLAKTKKELGIKYNTNPYELFTQYNLINEAKLAISETLDRQSLDVGKAAVELGISQSVLYRLMRKLKVRRYGLDKKSLKEILKRNDWNFIKVKKDLNFTSRIKYQDLLEEYGLLGDLKKKLKNRLEEHKWEINAVAKSFGLSWPVIKRWIEMFEFEEKAMTKEQILKILKKHNFKLDKARAELDIGTSEDYLNYFEKKGMRSILKKKLKGTLVQHDWKLGETAKVFGVGIGSIRKWIEEFGLTKAKYDKEGMLAILKQKDWNLKEAKDALGARVREDYYLFLQNHNLLGELKIKLRERLKDNNWALSTVANKFGVSQKAIQRWIKEFGIKKGSTQTELILEALNQVDWNIGKARQKIGLKTTESLYNFFRRNQLLSELKLKLLDRLRASGWAISPVSKSFGLSPQLIEELKNSFKLKRPTLSKSKILDILEKHEWNINDAKNFLKLGSGESIYDFIERHDLLSEFRSKLVERLEDSNWTFDQVATKFGVDNRSIVRWVEAFSLKREILSRSQILKILRTFDWDIGKAKKDLGLKKTENLLEFFKRNKLLDELKKKLRERLNEHNWQVTPVGKSMGTRPEIVTTWIAFFGLTKPVMTKEQIIEILDRNNWNFRYAKDELNMKYREKIYDFFKRYDALKEFKLKLIERLQELGGNVTGVARQFGVSPAIVTRWLNQFGLSRTDPKFRRKRTIFHRAVDTFRRFNVLDLAVTLASNPEEMQQALAILLTQQGVEMKEQDLGEFSKALVLNLREGMEVPESNLQPGDPFDYLRALMALQEQTSELGEHEQFVLIRAFVRLSYPQFAKDYEGTMKQLRSTLADTEMEEFLEKLVDHVDLFIGQGLKFQPSHMKTQLLPHQRVGAWALKNSDQYQNEGLYGFLLEDDTRLGKTIQTFAAMDPSMKAVVAVPATVMDTWMEQYRDHTTQDMELIPVRGSVEQKRKMILNARSKKGVILLVTIEDLRGKSDEEFEALNEGLDLVVVDEGQRIENYGGQELKTSSLQARAIHRLRSPRRWILSATPYTSHPRQLFSVFNLLHTDPETGKVTNDLYANRGAFNRLLAGTLKQMRWLYALKARIGLRRTKAELGQLYTAKNEIDPKKEGNYTVTEDQSHLVLRIIKNLGDYIKIYNSRVPDEEKISQRSIGVFLKLQFLNWALTDPTMLGEDVATTFWDGMDKMVQKRLKAKKKGIILAQNTAMIDKIVERYEAKGHKVARIDGSVSGYASVNGQLVVDQDGYPISAQAYQRHLFQDPNSGYDLVVLNVRAGVGLDLSAAEWELYAQPPVNYVEYYQSSDRALGLNPDPTGKTQKKVDVLFMVPTYPKAFLEKILNTPDHTYVEHGTPVEILYKGIMGEDKARFEMVMEGLQAEKGMTDDKALTRLVHAIHGFLEDPSMRRMSKKKRKEMDASSALYAVYRKAKGDRMKEDDVLTLVDAYTKTDVSPAPLGRVIGQKKKYDLNDLQYIHTLFDVPNKQHRDELLGMLPDLYGLIWKNHAGINELAVRGPPEIRILAETQPELFIPFLAASQFWHNQEDNEQVLQPTHDGTLLLFQFLEEFYADGFSDYDRKQWIKRYVYALVNLVDMSSQSTLDFLAHLQQNILDEGLSIEERIEFLEELGVLRQANLTEYNRILSLRKSYKQTRTAMKNAMRTSFIKLFGLPDTQETIDRIRDLARQWGNINAPVQMMARLAKAPKKIYGEHVEMFRQVMGHIINGTYEAWRNEQSLDPTEHDIQYRKKDKKFWSAFTREEDVALGDIRVNPRDFRKVRAGKINVLLDRLQDDEALYDAFGPARVQISEDLEDSEADNKLGAALREATEQKRAIEKQRKKAGQEAALNALEERIQELRLRQSIVRLVKALQGDDVDKMKTLLATVSRYIRELKLEENNKLHIAVAVRELQSTLEQQGKPRRFEDVQVQITANPDLIMRRGMMHEECKNCFNLNAGVRQIATLVDDLAARNKMLALVTVGGRIASISILKIRQTADGEPVIMIERPLYRWGYDFEREIAEAVKKTKLPDMPDTMVAGDWYKGSAKAEEIQVFTTGTRGPSEYHETLFGWRPRHAKVKHVAGVLVRPQAETSDATDGDEPSEPESRSKTAKALISLFDRDPLLLLLRAFFGEWDAFISQAKRTEFVLEMWKLKPRKGTLLEILRNELDELFNTASDWGEELARQYGEVFRTYRPFNRAIFKLAGLKLIRKRTPLKDRIDRSLQDIKSKINLKSSKVEFELYEAKRKAQAQYEETYDTSNPHIHDMVNFGQKFSEKNAFLLQTTVDTWQTLEEQAVDELTHRRKILAEGEARQWVNWRNWLHEIFEKIGDIPHDVLVRHHFGTELPSKRTSNDIYTLNGLISELRKIVEEDLGKYPKAFELLNGRKIIKAATKKKTARKIGTEEETKEGITRVEIQLDKQNYEVLGIGHSNRSIDALVDLLKKSGVKTIVDVRTRPYSRYNPHFNRKALQEALSEHGITYLWQGDKLGGKLPDYNDQFDAYMKDNPGNQFEDGIQQLLDNVRVHAGSVCLLCSEKAVHDCHRRFILDHLQKNHGSEAEKKKLAESPPKLKQGDLFSDLEDEGGTTGFIPWLWNWLVPKLRSRGWSDRRIVGVLGGLEEIIFGSIITTGGAFLIKFLFGIPFYDASLWSSGISSLIFLAAHWRAVVRLRDGAISDSASPSRFDKLTILFLGLILRIIYFISFFYLPFGYFNFMAALALVVLVHGLYNAYFAPWLKLALGMAKSEKDSTLDLLNKNKWDIGVVREKLRLPQRTGIYEFLVSRGLKKEFRQKLSERLTAAKWNLNDVGDDFGVTSITVKKWAERLGLKKPQKTKQEVLSILRKNKWNMGKAKMALRIHGAESLYGFFERAGVLRELKVELAKRLKDNNWLMEPVVRSFGTNYQQVYQWIERLALKKPKKTKKELLRILNKHNWKFRKAREELEILSGSYYAFIEENGLIAELKKRLQKALDEENWSMSAVSKRFEVQDRNIKAWIQSLGLTPPSRLPRSQIIEILTKHDWNMKKAKKELKLKPKENYFEFLKSHNLTRQLKTKLRQSLKESNWGIERVAVQFGVVSDVISQWIELLELQRPKLTRIEVVKILDQMDWNLGEARKKLGLTPNENLIDFLKEHILEGRLKNKLLDRLTQSRWAIQPVAIKFGVAGNTLKKWITFFGLKKVTRKRKEVLAILEKHGWNFKKARNDLGIIPRQDYFEFLKAHNLTEQLKKEILAAINQLGWNRKALGRRFGVTDSIAGNWVNLLNLEKPEITRQEILKTLEKIQWKIKDARKEFKLHKQYSFYEFAQDHGIVDVLKKKVLEQLIQNDWNFATVAENLGTTPITIKNWMKKLKIKKPKMTRKRILAILIKHDWNITLTANEVDILTNRSYIQFFEANGLSNEFKSKLIERLEEEKWTFSAVGKRFGVASNVITRWVDHFKLKRRKLTKMKILEILNRVDWDLSKAGIELGFKYKEDFVLFFRTHGLMKEFKAKLLKRLKANGWSKNAVSKEFGVTQKVIGKWMQALNIQRTQRTRNEIIQNLNRYDWNFDKARDALGLKYGENYYKFFQNNNLLKNLKSKLLDRLKKHNWSTWLASKDFGVAQATIKQWAKLLEIEIPVKPSRQKRTPFERAVDTFQKFDVLDLAVILSTNPEEMQQALAILLTQKKSDMNQKELEELSRALILNLREGHMPPDVTFRPGDPYDYLRALMALQAETEQLSEHEQFVLIRAFTRLSYPRFAKDYNGSLKELKKTLSGAKDNTVLQKLVNHVEKVFGEGLQFQPSHITTKLKPHQRIGAWHLRNSIQYQDEGLYGFLLEDDTRLGKTIQTFAAMYPKWKTVIAVPASVMDTWQEQYAEHTTGKMELIPVRGTVEEKRKAILKARNKKGVILLVSIEDMRGKKDDEFEALNEGLDLVVVDEGQKIQNYGGLELNTSTQQSKAIHRLKSRRKWILSASPYTSHPRQLFSVFNLLHTDPDGIVTNDLYASRRSFNRLLAGGLKRMRWLYALKARIGLRRTKSELGRLYTAKKEIDPAKEGAYEVTDDQAHLILRIIKNLGQYVREYNQRVGPNDQISRKSIGTFLKLQFLAWAMADPTILGEDIDTNYWNAMDRIVEKRLKKKKKGIIHAQNTAMIDNIIQRYQDKEFRVARIDGTVSGNAVVNGRVVTDRNGHPISAQAYQRHLFQDPKSGYDLVVMNVRAGVGLDLSQAEWELYAQLPTNYVEYYQSSDRALGLNPDQTEKTQKKVEALFMMPTYSESLIKALVKTPDHKYVQHGTPAEIHYQWLMGEDRARFEMVMEGIPLEAGMTEEKALQRLVHAIHGFLEDPSMKKLSKKQRKEMDASSAFYTTFRKAKGDRAKEDDVLSLVDSFTRTDVSPSSLGRVIGQKTNYDLDDLQYIDALFEIPNKQQRDELLGLLPDLYGLIWKKQKGFNDLSERGPPELQFLAQTQPELFIPFVAASQFWNNKEDNEQILQPTHDGTLLLLQILEEFYSDGFSDYDRKQWIKRYVYSLVNLINDDNRSILNHLAHLQQDILDEGLSLEEKIEFLEELGVLRQASSKEFNRIIKLRKSYKQTRVEMQKGMKTSFIKLFDLPDTRETVERIVGLAREWGNINAPVQMMARLAKAPQNIYGEHVDMFRQAMRHIVNGTYEKWRNEQAIDRTEFDIQYRKKDKKFWSAFTREENVFLGNIRVNPRDFRKVRASNVSRLLEFLHDDEVLYDAFGSIRVQISSDLEHEGADKKLGTELRKVAEQKRSLEKKKRNNQKALDELEEKLQELRLRQNVVRLAKALNDDDVEKMTRLLDSITPFIREPKQEENNKVQIAVAVRELQSTLEQQGKQRKFEEVSVQITSNPNLIMRRGMMHEECKNCFNLNSGVRQIATLVDDLAARNKMLALVTVGGRIASISVLKVRKMEGEDPVIMIERPLYRWGYDFEREIAEAIKRTKLPHMPDTMVAGDWYKGSEKEQRIQALTTGSRGPSEYHETLFGWRPRNAVVKHLAGVLISPLNQESEERTDSETSEYPQDSPVGIRANHFPALLFGLALSGDRLLENVNVLEVFGSINSLAYILGLVLIVIWTTKVLMKANTGHLRSSVSLNPYPDTKAMIIESNIRGRATNLGVGRALIRFVDIKDENHLVQEIRFLDEQNGKRGEKYLVFRNKRQKEKYRTYNKNDSNIRFIVSDQSGRREIMEMIRKKKVSELLVSIDSKVKNRLVDSELVGYLQWLQERQDDSTNKITVRSYVTRGFLWFYLKTFMPIRGLMREIEFDFRSLRRTLTNA